MVGLAKHFAKLQAAYARCALPQLVRLALVPSKHPNHTTAPSMHLSCKLGLGLDVSRMVGPTKQSARLQAHVLQAACAWCVVFNASSLSPRLLLLAPLPRATAERGAACNRASCMAGPAPHICCPRSRLQTPASGCC